MSFFSDPIGNISGAIHTVGKDISNATKNPLVDMAAAAALDYFTGGVGGLTGAGGLMDTYTGLGAAGNAALLTGGIAGLSSGNLAQGLMAGLAGYGGASLGEGMGMGNYNTPPNSGLDAENTMAGRGGAPVEERVPTPVNTNPAITPGGGYNYNQTPEGTLAKALPGTVPPTTTMPGTDKVSPFGQLTSWFGKQDLPTQLALGAAGVYGLKALATPQKLNVPNRPNTQFIRNYNYSPMGGYSYQGSTPAVGGGAATGGLVALAQGGGVHHYDDGGTTTTAAPQYTNQQISDYITQNNLSGQALTNAEQQFGVSQDQVNQAMGYTNGNYGQTPANTNTAPAVTQTASQSQYTPEQIVDYISQKSLSGQGLTDAEKQYGVNQDQVTQAFNAYNQQNGGNIPQYMIDSAGQGNTFAQGLLNAAVKPYSILQMDQTNKIQSDISNWIAAHPNASTSDIASAVDAYNKTQGVGANDVYSNLGSMAANAPSQYESTLRNFNTAEGIDPTQQFTDYLKKNTTINSVGGYDTLGQGAILKELNTLGMDPSQALDIAKSGKAGFILSPNDQTFTTLAAASKIANVINPDNPYAVINEQDPKYNALLQAMTDPAKMGPQGLAAAGVTPDLYTRATGNSNPASNVNWYNYFLDPQAATDQLASNAGIAKGTQYTVGLNNFGQQVLTYTDPTTKQQMMYAPAVAVKDPTTGKTTYNMASNASTYAAIPMSGTQGNSPFLPNFNQQTFSYGQDQYYSPFNSKGQIDTTNAAAIDSAYKLGFLSTSDYLSAKQALTKKSATGGLMALANGGAIKHYDDGGSIQDSGQGAMDASNPVMIGKGTGVPDLHPNEDNYTNYSNQQIANYVQQQQKLFGGDNAKSQAAIAAAMNQYGVTPEQVAAALGTSLGTVQSDYNTVMPTGQYATTAAGNAGNTAITDAQIQQAVAAAQKPGGGGYENIQNQMIQNGVSTAQLAKALGVDASTIGTDYSQTVGVQQEGAKLGPAPASTPFANDTQWAKYMDDNNLSTNQMAAITGLAPNEVAARYALAEAQLKAQQNTNTNTNTQTGPGNVTTPTPGTGNVTKIQLPTNSGTNAPAGTLNPYGNVNNPGDITKNANGTTTVTSNVPGRPYGGFSGMDEVVNAYTAGGGSTGYTIPTYKNMDEFNAANNTLTGGSKAAYDYLMGKSPWNPLPTTPTGQVSVPYQSLMGLPMSNQYQVSTPQIYDATTHTYKPNPNYDPNFSATRDYLGSPQVGISSNTAKILGYTALPNGIYGYSNGDGTYTGIDGHKYDSTGKDLSATPVQSSAAGGLQGLAHGGQIKGYAGNAGSLVNNASEAYENSNLNEAAAYQNDPLEAFYKTVPSNVMRTPTGAGLAAALYSQNLNPNEAMQLSQRLNSGVNSQYLPTGRMRHTMTNMAAGGMSVGHLGGYSDGGRLLRGPGDGVSDSIPATIGASDPEPARLADGEFVVPARIVSELGNGSTEAGARQLYKMMDRIQNARRKTTGKDAVATNTNASKYLPA